MTFQDLNIGLAYITVGKCNWKYHELGNFYVGRFEVGKFLFKLETSEQIKGKI